MSTSIEIKRNSSPTIRRNVKYKNSNIKNKKITIKKPNTSNLFLSVKNIKNILFKNKERTKTTVIVLLLFSLLFTGKMYKETKNDLQELVTKFNQMQYSTQSEE